MEDFLHFEFRVILTFFRKDISWGMNPGGSSSIFKLYIIKKMLIMLLKHLYIQIHKKTLPPKSLNCMSQGK
jgi:hypothetical protein